MNTLAIRKRALNGERLLGTFLNTGSAVTAEIAGRSGLDWCLFDMEHGMGSWEMLLYQLMALEGRGAAPIVRLPGIDLPSVKRSLDLGAHGIMIPNVNTAEEAARAVSFSRYPPHGERGVAGMNRGAQFGRKLDERLASAHENTLVIAQIESPLAVANVDAIAAVDGVDVLFVGPLDLSVNMGIAKEFAHPEFVAACDKVANAAKANGKASGILLLDPGQLEATYGRGFNFVAVGSDGSFVADAIADILSRKGGA